MVFLFPNNVTYHRGGDFFLSRDSFLKLRRYIALYINFHETFNEPEMRPII